MADDLKHIDLENDEFQNAWKLIKYTHSSVFLTGKAGTGKSTFLRYICSKTKKKYVVLAPTGIAAVNVGGQTMHSFFRIPFKPLLPNDPDFAVSRLRQRLKYPKALCKLIKNLQLIIIDEISMVRAYIIYFIDISSDLKNFGQLFILCYLWQYYNNLLSDKNVMQLN